MPDIRCFDCGEANCLAVNLADGDTITCSECDGTFDVAAVADQIAALTALYRWLRQHPARGEGMPTAEERRQAADEATGPLGDDVPL